MENTFCAARGSRAPSPGTCSLCGALTGSHPDRGCALGAGHLSRAGGQDFSLMSPNFVSPALLGASVQQQGLGHAAGLGLQRRGVLGT